MSAKVSDWPQRQAPGRLEIARAVPAGSRRARDQRGWVLAVMADPVIAGLRADARRAVLELARILARHADWRTRTTWRPRERTCAEIGSSRDPSRPLSIAAYKRARRVLEERGFLGLVARAWTPMLRAVALAEETGGTSAVFVLAIPRRKTRLPAHGESAKVNEPVTRSCKERGKGPRAREAPPGTTPEPTGPWPALRTPENRSEEEQAADVLRDRCPPLQRLSARYVRYLAREWFASGWAPEDIRWAIEHSPAGRQHGYTSTIRHVPGWVGSRLAAWRDSVGRPVVAPSQRRKAERERIRAGQQAARAARREAAERAALVDVAARAAEARAMLLRRPRPPVPPPRSLPGAGSPR